MSAKTKEKRIDPKQRQRQNLSMPTEMVFATVGKMQLQLDTMTRILNAFEGECKNLRAENEDLKAENENLKKRLAKKKK